MPVRKFRSVEDLPPPPAYEPGDPRLSKAMDAVWAFTRSAHPRRFRPGVRRYRSASELYRAESQAESEYVVALAAGRRGAPSR
jgi:hypothetical protein